MRRCRLILAWLLILVCAAAAQTDTRPMPSLRMLQAARAIPLDAAEAAVMRQLRQHRLVVAEQGRMPPAGLTSYLLALPPDDRCTPRGEPWTCPNLRVHFHRDGRRGLRVMRVESHDPLPDAAGLSVAAVQAWATQSFGPPLETATWGERVRGGRLNLWRQLWRDPDRDGAETEVIATLWGDPGEPEAFGSAEDAALGLGYVHADVAVESMVAAMRRQLPR